MISSMTGYGKAIAQKGDLIIEAEIKSLNSRYLELSLRLPKFLYDKEFEIRERVRSQIKRGKVFLNITFKKNNIEDDLFIYDPVAVKSTLKMLKDIRKAAGLKDKIKFTDLIQFQHLFLKAEPDEFNEEMELLNQVIDNAIFEMNKMRNAEGRELEKDIRKRIEIIELAVYQIEKIKEENLRLYFENFKDKARQLVSSFIDNEQRLITELALLSERFDVTEECVRLRSHIKLFLDTMENSEEAGRKLNFILQEMNREANTINSKAVSSEISHAGILIKEEIEKIREQIQNIE
ncbi:MAG: YicC family protein [Melioribacter sp.]|uniref:YicC/YloC family endoribonuclease n=1 Tax=Rosettibacter primus TaxID=3111523 RepID=UPI00247C5196|nr:YicC family protein [Melioribacter sp.]